MIKITELKKRNLTLNDFSLIHLKSILLFSFCRYVVQVGSAINSLKEKEYNHEDMRQEHRIDCEAVREFKLFSL